MPLYSPPTLSLGRFLLALNAVLSMTGPYQQDFNETHVYNPRWPPHARFHNGQTMSLGLLLGLLTLFLAFRPAFSPFSSSTSGEAGKTTPEDGDLRDEMAVAKAQLELERKDALAAALVGSLYWVAGLSAALYPGALPVDPEFGGGFPQLPVFIGIGTLAWVGYFLEGTRLTNAKLAIQAKAGKFD